MSPTVTNAAELPQDKAWVCPLDLAAGRRMLGAVAAEPCVDKESVAQ